jgi:hypothetical protein
MLNYAPYSLALPLPLLLSESAALARHMRQKSIRHSHDFARVRAAGASPQCVYIASLRLETKLICKDLDCRLGNILRGQLRGTSD